MFRVEIKIRDESRNDDSGDAWIVGHVDVGGGSPLLALHAVTEDIWGGRIVTKTPPTYEKVVVTP